MPERRLKVTLAYDGTGFHGWQVQPGLETVQGTLGRAQGTLGRALAEIEGRPVHVDGSGRTDAGVHALAQVAAFSLANPIPPPNLKKALNRLLPNSIRILAVEEAAADFHPRYAARSKTYEYRIFRGEVCSPFEWRYVYHYPYPLDVERMAVAAPRLEGAHDFSAFAAPDEPDRPGESKVRTVFRSRGETAGDRFLYRVRGSGFLKHMVRNIVGTLIEIGKGNLGEADLDALLSAREKKAGPAAPARGLFLVEVEY